MPGKQDMLDICQLALPPPRSSSPASVLPILSPLMAHCFLLLFIALSLPGARPPLLTIVFPIPTCPDHGPSLRQCPLASTPHPQRLSCHCKSALIIHHLVPARSRQQREPGQVDLGWKQVEYPGPSVQQLHHF